MQVRRLESQITQAEAQAHTAEEALRAAPAGSPAADTDLGREGGILRAACAGLLLSQRPGLSLMASVNQSCH